MMKIKNIVITAVTCIAIGASACSYAAPSVTTEESAEENNPILPNNPEITTAEYDALYASESQIPYPVTINCNSKADYVLSLAIKVPADTVTLQAEDENWLFLAEETDVDENIIIYTYAYRKYTERGEQIVFTPILETEDGISEDEFYAISIKWIVIPKEWLRDDVYDEWENGNIKNTSSLIKTDDTEIADEALRVAYEKYISEEQEDPKIAGPELIVGEQYHVLDIYRTVDNGAYYCKGVMEDADGNRIAVDLSNDNDTIIAGDTVVYLGEQTFDIVNEETVNAE